MTDTTTIDEARAAIEFVVMNEFPFLTREFDGVTHEPTDADGALHDIWARFSIVWGDAFASTMGREDVGQNQVIGVLFVDVFGDIGHGRGPLTKQASDIRDHFNRQAFEDIEFDPMSAPVPVEDDASGWLHVQMRGRFTFDEIH